MTEKIEQAKQEVEELYRGLVEVIYSTIAPFTKQLEDIMKELSKGINFFSNSELWDFQVRLSLEAYRLGDIREQSSLKDACAEALYKEGLAKAYAANIGATETRKQQSILDSVDKQAVAMLYESAANVLKTKCDEAHRMINVLQGIQISRAAEAKQTGNPRSEGTAAEKLLVESFTNNNNNI